ncbi:MAG: hypothetical protein V3S17_06140 [candidate division Zixibacteria bacterium]
MKVKLIITLVFALALFALMGVAVAEEQAMTGVEGNYMLVSQEFPDGTRHVPPLVGGMINITSTHWNLNHWWSNAEGEVFSSSKIAEYSMTDSTYIEKLLYSATNEGAGGGPMKYNFEHKIEIVPVTRDGTKISIQFPLGTPLVAFDGNKLTVTEKGVSTDHWEKVE